MPLILHLYEFLCRRWEVYSDCIQQVTIPMGLLIKLVDLIRCFGNKDDLSNEEVFHTV